MDADDLDIKVRLEYPILLVTAAFGSLTFKYSVRLKGDHHSDYFVGLSRGLQEVAIWIGSTKESGGIR